MEIPWKCSGIPKTHPDFFPEIFQEMSMTSTGIPGNFLEAPRKFQEMFRTFPGLFRETYGIF